MGNVAYKQEEPCHLCEHTWIGVGVNINVHIHRCICSVAYKTIHVESRNNNTYEIQIYITQNVTVSERIGSK